MAADSYKGDRCHNSEPVFKAIIFMSAPYFLYQTHFWLFFHCRYFSYSLCRMRPPHTPQP